jgi:hypothetical protein
LGGRSTLVATTTLFFFLDPYSFWLLYWGDMFSEGREWSRGVMGGERKEGTGTTRWMMVVSVAVVVRGNEN